MTPEPMSQATDSDDKAETHKLTVESLGQQHREAFTRALSNALPTPTAEFAYAQVINGAPLTLG
ncbi:hypothetical protein VM1G_02445 [Cytospora mali]|uniref:Uncharacterized protein n=1 Tax=Cytospora mali TaxID=578113 RepID=A0A194VR20_CYTMA|nr:hypothetical protein VM1G_02445 [Valsa mali]